MGNLFDESDFNLFSEYQGRTQYEAPEGQQRLRKLYDKLGEITDGLSNLGYKCEITRNPLKQGGRGTMKYAEYHWARIYPPQQEIYNGCKNKIFFVVVTRKEGVQIHIDSYSIKGYDCHSRPVAAKLKDETPWKDIPPHETPNYSCDDYVKIISDYIKENWKQFNLFGKEFNIPECIKELEIMATNDIKNLLLSNYNLILTGAPGTGKTYLAKKIAEAMGAEYKLVQFHPSYDYTDFVEGLRPIKRFDALGFERKDGVFKAFCKEAAINSSNALSFDKAYTAFIEDIKQGKIKTINLKTKESAELEIRDDNIGWYSESEKNHKSSNVVSRDRIKKLFEAYNTLEKLEKSQNINKDIHSIIGGCDASYYWGVLHYLLKNYLISKPYVLIIDEINRGEISKIFGELFYSIDAGYRGKSGKVETQYQNLIPKEGDVDFDPNNADIFRNGFFIPENVYIIGTMNDIDRSVESMDFAMRRRFAWKEISVESRQDMLDEADAWGSNGKPSPEIIANIKARMNNLNAAIIDRYGTETLSNKDKIGLSKAYQIGAAYFLKYALYNNFDDLWTNHLEGLLYEYLRGKTNIDEKIERLHQAYNNTAQP